MWSYSASTRLPEVASQQPAELEELNAALRALAAVFPNIRPEVFREMLTTLSKESRAEVVAEHLLRNGGKWVRGRWRLPASGISSPILREVYEHNLRATRSTSQEPGNQDGPGQEHTDELVPLEESFRTDSYSRAVYTALRQEFTSLSRSTIHGVLAEQNFSYTLARPILLGLAAKTWRVSLSKMFSRFRHGSSSRDTPADEHHMLQWIPVPGLDKSLKTPSLRPSGDAELDIELRRTVLDPILNRRRTKTDAISLELALILNEQEAEEAQALYECQVCYSDVTFEQVVICTAAQHAICHSCIQRALSEALYGQSWDLTIDHRRGQLACIAPTSERCQGCIPRALSERAILAGKGGSKMWQQFETRLADEALLALDIDTIRCPFCPYTEIDALYLPSRIVWGLSTRNPLWTLLLLLLGLDVALLALLISAPVLALVTLLGLPLAGFNPFRRLQASIRSVLHNALALKVRETQLSRKFDCRNPECRRSSCLDCRKSWRDIHECHDPAAVSLRTTIEAARTAAFKRTCPRCGVGFVKESGCNKMVCVCGYAMCYICRQGLADKKGGRFLLGDDDNPDQGYKHFCQHFRPLGGRCTECDKCDLYRAEDEEEIVRRAGDRAEREWRARNDTEGAVQVVTSEHRSALGATVGALRNFAIQRAVYWWISNVLSCKLQTEQMAGSK